MKLMATISISGKTIKKNKKGKSLFFFLLQILAIKQALIVCFVNLVGEKGILYSKLVGYADLLKFGIEM